MSIKRKNNNGFTLIELLVTISVIVILTFIGVPTFKSVTNNSRISTTNNSLVGNLALARSEAVNRNKAVSVCASSNGSSCTSTAWELGWIVFTDEGTAGSVDSADKILRIQGKTVGRLTVTSSGPYVRFKPGGEVARLDDTLEKPTFLASLLHSLLPGKDAWASEGDDTSTSSTDSDSQSSDNDSQSSDSDSGSGSSSGGTMMSCVAPASAAGGSDDSSSDSHSNDSHSNDSQSNTADNTSGDSNSGDSDSTSGGSTSASSGSAGTATCDGQPLAANTFLICDASKASEIGNLVTVGKTGRISQTKVRCN